MPALLILALTQISSVVVLEHCEFKLSSLAADAKLVVGTNTQAARLRQHLYLKRDGKFTLVHDRSDLAGRVSLRSAAQALEFARLDVSPVTGGLFRNGARWSYEIMPRDLVSGLTMLDQKGERFFGDPALFGDGVAGVVSNQTFEQLKLSRAHAWEEKGAFVVVQPLVQSSPDGAFNSKVALLERKLVLSRKGETVKVSVVAIEANAPVRWRSGDL